MKSASLTAAVVLATLCCPLLSAMAGQSQPAVTQEKSIAITASTPSQIAPGVATKAINIPVPTQPQTRLDASAAPAPPDVSAYTGIVIDASGFAGIQRSPSPAIYGPDGDLIYPDRSHVPTPDQVQDESIVRYYRTIDDAKAGVGGSNPLVIAPTSIVGPAKDSVVLSTDEVTLFKALDKRLHYLDTWKVGFLVPANQ